MLQPLKFAGCLVWFATLTGPLVAQSELEALRPLIGVWDTHDTYHPESGAPIEERGVRTCSFVLHNTYIQCETIAPRPNGRERSYRFLINYNRDVGRYEMLSIWSNVPPKLVQELRPSEQHRRWQVTTIAVVGGEQSPHWSELVFEAPDRIVWTGRRIREGQDPASAPISFVETWTRRS